MPWQPTPSILAGWLSHVGAKNHTQVSCPCVDFTGWARSSVPNNREKVLFSKSCFLKRNRCKGSSYQCCKEEKRKGSVRIQWRGCGDTRRDLFKETSEKGSKEPKVTKSLAWVRERARDIGEKKKQSNSRWTTYFNVKTWVLFQIQQEATDQCYTGKRN